MVCNSRIPKGHLDLLAVRELDFFLLTRAMKTSDMTAILLLCRLATRLRRYVFCCNSYYPAVFFSRDGYLLENLFVFKFPVFPVFQPCTGNL